MNKIVFPLKFNMQGPQVADLHSALLALLDRAFIFPGDESVRQAAAAALQSELAPPAYGNVTGKLVSTFQGERALPVTGDVNEQTANAFNKLLADAGLLDLEPPSAFRLVTGFVRREDGLPLQGARVRATHVADGWEIRLADDSADAEGRYTIRYDALPGAGGVNLKVSAIAEDGRTIGVSTLITNAKIVEIVDLTVPLVAPAEGRETIQGTILLSHGQPAADGFLREVARSGGELIEARPEIPACRSVLIPLRQKKTRVRRPPCDKDRDSLLQQLQVDSTASAQSQLVRRSRQNYAVAVSAHHLQHRKTQENPLRTTKTIRCRSKAPAALRASLNVIPCNLQTHHLLPQKYLSHCLQARRTATTSLVVLDRSSILAVVTLPC